MKTIPSSCAATPTQPAFSKKTMAKLPNARKKRPLRLVLIAAAAVAVLCSAAAIVHYASVEPAEQPYTLKASSAM